MNKTISMGNLTDDPVIRTTPTGKKVAEFTLALNRGKDGADFPRFIAWEKKAEFVENYCHKGMKVLVEGRIQTGSYDKDGRKIYTTDIICENIEFCEKKKTDSEPPRENNDFMSIPDGIGEEMPFA